MITYTLDAFIAALREAAHTAEQRLTCRRCEPTQTAQRLDGAGLFELFAPTEVTVSQLRIDIPIWIERSLLSERVAFRTCTRWRKRRSYNLSIALDGEDLSRTTVSLDDLPIRRPS